MAPYSKIKDQINRLRRDYKQGTLHMRELEADPIKQFENWFSEAIEHSKSPDAMSLSTCSNGGEPSVRTVLLREVLPEGFVFYSNYQSRKGKQLSENPRAAILFYWPELEKQVTIEGTTEKTSYEKSNEYFKSRPIGAQYAVLASEQSQVVSNREALEKKVEDLKKEIPESELKCPEHWGGYLLKPESLEFWQGRPDRLNDRIRYRREQHNWIVERVQP